MNEEFSKLFTCEEVQAWWNWFKANWKIEASGCLLWQGEVNLEGYACVSGQAHYRADYIRWENETGQIIPSGYCLKHTCGNRHCGEISHLQLVTRSEAHRKFADPLKQLQAKVTIDAATGCHLAAINKSGMMKVGGRTGKTISVRKFVYQQTHGSESISDGDKIANSCNPPQGSICVNPTHLIKESRSEAGKRNAARRWTSGETNHADV